MDKKHFENLIAGVKQMKAHMAGKALKGIRVYEAVRPRVKPIQVKVNLLP